MPGNVKWAGFGHSSFQSSSTWLTHVWVLCLLLFPVSSARCVCVTRALCVCACCSQGERAIRNVLIILSFLLWPPKPKCSACIYLGVWCCCGGSWGPQRRLQLPFQEGEMQRRSIVESLKFTTCWTLYQKGCWLTDLYPIGRVFPNITKTLFSFSPSQPFY